ncbi:MAG: hypothetical protein LBR07_08915 [Puniceicoccales bacterium]|nr:hypothetical protein [Puniceicoccales bacterium]
MSKKQRAHAFDMIYMIDMIFMILWIPCRLSEIMSKKAVCAFSHKAPLSCCQVATHTERRLSSRLGRGAAIAAILTQGGYRRIEDASRFF